MAKERRRSNRETKKPKKSAGEKSKAAASATPAPLSGPLGRPAPAASYKDRYK